MKKQDDKKKVKPPPYINLIEAAEIAEMTTANIQLLNSEGRGPPQHEVAGHPVYIASEVRAWKKNRIKLKPGPKPQKKKPNKPERK